MRSSSTTGCQRVVSKHAYPDNDHFEAKLPVPMASRINHFGFIEAALSKKKGQLLCRPGSTFELLQKSSVPNVLKGADGDTPR